MLKHGGEDGGQAYGLLCFAGWCGEVCGELRESRVWVGWKDEWGLGMVGMVRF